MTATGQGRYKMVISRTTIDKLGIKLYDKVSAAVAELIANAYDADAEEVVVEAPLGVYLASKVGGTITDRGYEIHIRDDGYGMTPDEVQEFYLQVGKDRRANPKWGATSRERGRPVMGRKGIGKLAPFGICREIEVISSGGKKTQKGYLTAHLILRYDDILQETDEPYSPDVGDLDGTFRKACGTEIVLRKFAYRMIPRAETFHRQLAARFGIVRPDWKIVVRDTNDPDETSFVVGDRLLIALLDGTLIEVDDRPVKLNDGTTLPVGGWVAYSKDSYRDEVMAGVRIYARGKIVSQTRDFDIPSGFTGEHKLRSYLVGTIHADWLDDDDSEDLIRSDRQDILWNSERGQAFQKWGRALLKELAAKGETSLRARVWELFLQKSNIEERVRKQFHERDMRKQVLTVARMLISRGDREALEDEDHVEALVRLAFAVGPHRVLVSKLQEIADQDVGPFQVLVELFNRARIAEMYSLGQVAFERVRAIKNLRDKWLESAVEAELQRIVENAPWLINPQWTQLSANRTLETFRRSFEDWHRKTKGEKVITTAIGHARKRPDFVLLNFQGRLEVVEIKAPDHELRDDEFQRLLNYRYALRDFLEENESFKRDFPGGVHLTLVCDYLNLSATQEEHFELLKERGELDHRTWQVFLAAAEQANQDFLDILENTH